MASLPSMLKVTQHRRSSGLKALKTCPLNQDINSGRMAMITASLWVVMSPERMTKVTTELFLKMIMEKWSLPSNSMSLSREAWTSGPC